MNQVVVKPCKNVENYASVLQEIISLLGEARLREKIKGKRVLLKPNLCIDLPPERGATTHPALVDALIDLVKAYGAAEIIVGEGPGVGVPGDVFGATGVRAVCERKGVALVNFNQDRGRRIDWPRGLSLKQALIASPYFSADTIINLPVLKSHSSVWISGAMKNMMGFLVNLEKHEVHFKGVTKSIVDLTHMLRQDLVIMDGVIGMMGEGPIGGPPAQAGLLLAGWNPAAVDMAAARIMGFRAEKIPFLTLAVSTGLVSSNLEILGMQENDIKRNWMSPLVAKHRLISRLMMAIMTGFFRRAGKSSGAVVNAEKCTGCGRCRDMCPYKAITLEESLAIVKKELCRLCLCCTEVCTNMAITLKGRLPEGFQQMRNH